MEFEEFKKIPRIFRDCVITEKIDGTNGQILIKRILSEDDTGRSMGDVYISAMTGEGLPILNEGMIDPPLLTVSDYAIWAGSRNRWVYNRKSEDNSGFASWVAERAPLLVEILGEGRHYGEFWGAGIQRRYGLTGNDKRFSLFHPKWGKILIERELGGAPIPSGLGFVPILYQGKFETKWVEDCLFRLRQFGSVAATGFMDAEGVVVYHDAAKQYFKATILNDEKPKGSTE